MDALKKAHGHLLVVDDAALAALSWSQEYKHGLAELMEAMQLRGVVRLADALLPGELAALAEHDKLAFVVASTFVTPQVIETMCKVILAAPRTECCVFTAISAKSHALYLRRRDDEQDYFDEVAYKLKEWIRQSQTAKGESKRFVKSKATVMQLPVLACHVAPDVLLMPAAHDVFPNLLNRTYPQTDQQDGKLTNSSFAHALAALVLQHELAEDFFAIGSTSVSIARQTIQILQEHRMPASPSQSQNTPSPDGRRLAAVLIDRTADVITPCLHADSLLDRIFNVLPRASPGTADVELDFLPVSNDNGKADTTLPQIQVTLSESRASIDEHISQRLKNSVMLLRKELTDAVTKEKLPYRPPKVVSKIGASHLAALETMLRDPAVAAPQVLYRHLSVIQLALATEAALIAGDAKNWDERQSTEKVLLLSAAQEGTVVLAQLNEVLPQVLSKQGAHEPLTLRDALSFACVCYALLGDVLALDGDGVAALASGTDDADEQSERAEAEAEAEVRVQQSLVDILTHRHGDAQALRWVAADEAEVPASVREAMRLLRAVSATRALFAKCRDPSLVPGAPFIRHLMSLLLSPSKPPIEGLRHVTDEDTLNRLFKGISSRFLKSNSPRPDEAAVVLLVFVGGVTFTEVREIREAIQQAKITSPRFIVVGTDIATADTTCDRLFAQL